MIFYIEDNERSSALKLKVEYVDVERSVKEDNIYILQNFGKSRKGSKEKNGL